MKDSSEWIKTEKNETAIHYRLTLCNGLMIKLLHQLWWDRWVVDCEEIGFKETFAGGSIVQSQKEAEAMVLKRIREIFDMGTELSARQAEEVKSA